MIRQLCLIFGFIFIIAPATLLCQGTPPRLKDIDLDGAETLEEVMEIVENHYAWHKEDPNEYESALLKWKRWEWYMSSHLGQSGEFVNIPERLLRAVKLAETMTDESNRAIYSYWQSEGPTSFPYGNIDSKHNGLGRVDRIAFHPTDPNTIYIGTPFGGLWKTVNDGDSWTCLTDHLPSISIGGIVISHANPNHIYILTGSGDSNWNSATTLAGYIGNAIGVLKSTDGGYTWSETGQMPGSNGPGPGYVLVQDPQNASVLLAGTASGLYRTQNGGNTWSHIDSVQPVSDIKFHPTNNDIIYAARWSRFIRSDDNGLTWDQGIPFTPSMGSVSPHAVKRIQMAVSPDAPNTVYVLAGPCTAPGEIKGLWKSINSGQTFGLITRTPNIFGKLTDGSDSTDATHYIMGLTAAPDDIGMLVACGYTVWRSENHGVNWEYSTTYSESAPYASDWIHADVHDVQYNPLNNMLYAASDGGIYKSTDDGETWTDLSEGVQTTMFYHMRTWNGSSPKMLGGCHDNGIKYRRDWSEEWFHITQADGFDIVFNPLNGQPLYGTANSGVNRYYNDGADADPIPADGYTDWFKTLAVHNTRPDTVILGTELIQWSFDAGDTWNDANQGSGSWALASCPSNNSKFYAAGGEGAGMGDETNSGAYVSTNNGQTWNPIHTGAGFPDSWTKITDINVQPINSTNVYVTFGGFGNDGEKIFKSTNSGATWSNITDNLPNVPVHCVGVDDDNSLYIGTDIGVFFRSPGMADWMYWSNGLPKAIVTDISVQDNYVRCSTMGRGAWRSLKADGCTDHLNLVQSLSGDWLFETDNYITSTSDVTSGAGTFVTLKAGNHVDLLTNFEVANGSRFLGLTGPCGQGGIPEIWQPSDEATEVTRNADGVIQTDISHAFPLGSIDNIERSDKTAIIDFSVRESGNIEFVLEQNGHPMKVLYGKSTNYGQHQVVLDSEEFDRGFYFLVMYNEGRVAHFQELEVE